MRSERLGKWESRSTIWAAYTGAYEATDLTRNLAQIYEENLYRAFARHILLNLGGLRVVQGAQEKVPRRADRCSSVTIFLLDKDDFEAVRANAANIARILTAQAERIRDLRLGAPYGAASRVRRSQLRLAWASLPSKS